MLATVAEILFAVLLLVGVLKREKLIAFEAYLSDRLAYWIAGMICRRRAARLQKVRALRARRVRQDRRAALHLVQGQSAAPTGRFIA